MKTPDISLKSSIQRYKSILPSSILSRHSEALNVGTFILLIFFYLVVPRSAEAQSFLTERERESLSNFIGWVEVCNYQNNLQRREHESLNEALSSLEVYYNRDNEAIFSELNSLFQSAVENSTAETFNLDNFADISKSCDNLIQSFSDGVTIGNFVERLANELGSAPNRQSSKQSQWIIVTSLIQPEYYTDPQKYPLKITILEGSDFDGSTIDYATLGECEAALTQMMESRIGYNLRRTVVGSVLQAVRTEYLDVVQCVELVL